MTEGKGGTVERLTNEEFQARVLARSRYHDRLFAENRPRPTNEQFDEGWEAARAFYRATPSDTEQLLSLRAVAEKARAWICRVSNQYALGVDDPYDEIAALNNALGPPKTDRHALGVRREG
jgi:hypothetical protein